MKFLDSHRLDILKAFDNHGFQKEDFSFLKRRGRIITKHHSTGHTFSFFLKKDIRIDENYERQEHSFFEIKIQNKPLLKVSLWKNVIANMNEWIPTLNK